MKPFGIGSSRAILHICRSLIIFSAAGLWAAGAVQAESPRFAEPQPAPEILEAVQQYKQLDPKASFSFFNGRVDGFSTRPKPQVPHYAEPVLQQLGLPTTKQPLRFLPPTAFGPRPVQNLDTNLDVQLPFEQEGPEPSHFHRRGKTTRFPWTPSSRGR